MPITLAISSGVNNIGPLAVKRSKSIDGAVSSCPWRRSRNISQPTTTTIIAGTAMSGPQPPWLSPPTASIVANAGEPSGAILTAMTAVGFR